MCLISALKKGQKKYSKEVTEFIKQGAESNSSGSGFCFKRDGDDFIVVKKGYFQVEKLLEVYHSCGLKDEDEVIIHHRIPTSGKTDDLNTHPFIVADTYEEATLVDTITNKIVFAHNGVFYKYSKNGSDYSDTCNFAVTFLSIPEVSSVLRRDVKLFKDLFDTQLGSNNKLAIMYPEKDKPMDLIGNFQEEGGYCHSNNGYKTYTTNRGGSEYPNHYNNTPRNHTPYARNLETTEEVITREKGKFVHMSIGGENKDYIKFDGNSMLITKENCEHFLYRFKSSSMRHDSYTEYFMEKKGFGTDWVNLSEVTTPSINQIFGGRCLREMMTYVTKPAFKDVYLTYMLLDDEFPKPSKNQIKKAIKCACRYSKSGYRHFEKIKVNTLGLALWANMKKKEMSNPLIVVGETLNDNQEIDYTIRPHKETLTTIIEEQRLLNESVVDKTADDIERDEAEEERILSHGGFFYRGEFHDLYD